MLAGIFKVVVCFNSFSDDELVGVALLGRVLVRL
jgi:hypothetical protein